MFEKVFTAVFLTAVLSNWTFASPAPEVCGELVKQKQPAAYLIDSHDARVQGPVGLGKIELGNDVDDEHFSITTTYRVIVRPLGLAVRTPVPGMGYGASLLPEKTSVCPGTKTFRLVLNWVRAKGEARPYSFEAMLPEFELADKSGYGEDVPGLYRFDARLVGEMIKPGR